METTYSQFQTTGQEDPRRHNQILDLYNYKSCSSRLALLRITNCKETYLRRWWNIMNGSSWADTVSPPSSKVVDVSRSNHIEGRRIRLPKHEARTSRRRNIFAAKNNFVFVWDAAKRAAFSLALRNQTMIFIVILSAHSLGRHCRNRTTEYDLPVRFGIFSGDELILGLTASSNIRDQPKKCLKKMEDSQGKENE